MVHLPNTDLEHDPRPFNDATSMKHSCHTKQCLALLYSDLCTSDVLTVGGGERNIHAPKLVHVHVRVCVCVCVCACACVCISCAHKDHKSKSFACTWVEHTVCAPAIVLHTHCTHVNTHICGYVPMCAKT